MRSIFIVFLLQLIPALGHTMNMQQNLSWEAEYQSDEDWLQTILRILRVDVTQYSPSQIKFYENFFYVNGEKFAEFRLGSFDVPLVRFYIDGYGNNILHRAVLAHNKSLIFNLISFLFRDLLDARNDQGRTPLQLAKNYPEIQEIFKQRTFATNDPLERMLERMSSREAPATLLHYFQPAQKPVSSHPRRIDTWTKNSYEEVGSFIQTISRGNAPQDVLVVINADDLLYTESNVQLTQLICDIHHAGMEVLISGNFCGHEIKAVWQAINMSHLKYIIFVGPLEPVSLEFIPGENSREIYEAVGNGKYFCVREKNGGIRGRHAMAIFCRFSQERIGAFERIIFFDNTTNNEERLEQDLSLLNLKHDVIVKNVKIKNNSHTRGDYINF